MFVVTEEKYKVKISTLIREIILFKRISYWTRNEKKILIIQLKIYSFVNCVGPVRNSDKFFSIGTYFAIIWRERLFESKEFVTRQTILQILVSRRGTF